MEIFQVPFNVCTGFFTSATLSLSGFANARLLSRSIGMSNKPVGGRIFMIVHFKAADARRIVNAELEGLNPDVVINTDIH